MSVVFGNIEFDRVAYDEGADVLYLSASGAEPVFYDESAEGHGLAFDANGEVCKLTVVGYRHHAEPDGTITITVPHRERLGVPDELVPA